MPLPPTSFSKKTAAKKKPDEVQKKAVKKRKRENEFDDAPRAFKRLMALKEGKLPPKSVEDTGETPGKKKKKSKEEETRPNLSEELKIRPGERLSEFAQRVDAALPLGGLVKKTVKNGKDPLGLKVRQTKKERKIQNMIKEWREIDRKVKERLEEERELQEEKDLETEMTYGVSLKMELEGTGKKKKKKGKGKKFLGEVGDPDEDPWEEIKRRRGESKPGLNDVATAPPELKKPKKNLLVRGATVAVQDIPKAAGSLRQREELQSIRQQIVEQYRKMMAERRPTVGT